MGQAYNASHNIHDSDLQITDKDYEAIRTKEGMMKAFSRIGMTERRIDVTNIFARGRDELKDNNSKLETAARIARKVLDKGAFSPSVGRI